MVGDRQAPGQIGPRRTRVGDPDPRAREDGRLRVGPGPRLDADRRSRIKEIGAGVGPIQVEGSRDESGTRGEPRVGHRSQALECGGHVLLTVARVLDCPLAPSTHDPLGPSRPHRVDALDRLDRADEERRRPADPLADDVQAVVHPVDKVHVGDPGRPVHDRVATSPPEAGMGRLVILADVRLELDDAAGTATWTVVPDEPAAKERSPDLQGRQVENVAIAGSYDELTAGRCSGGRMGSGARTPTRIRE